MSIIMNKMFFLRKVLRNNLFGLSVLAALVLLLCSIVYTDLFTGERYTFISLFYDGVAKEALDMGKIQVISLLTGYDTGYLWMFCPIIVGIPCVYIKKTERFEMFRMGKNRYVFTKYFSSLFAAGMVLLLAYLLYAILGMFLMKEILWDVNILKKFISVFFWGIYSAIPSMILAEFVRNKYLILCIPFVLNYFMCTFFLDFLPSVVREYVSPYSYQIFCFYPSKNIAIFFGVLGLLMLGCGIVKKILLEEKLDCGQ